jgi:hypothetical protein
MFELAEDVLEELERDALGLGQRLAFDRALTCRCELGRRAHRIVHLR